MKRLALISSAVLLMAFGPNDGGAVIGMAFNGRPSKGDAQICIINAWLRAHYPTSVYLPENGWREDPPGYHCPDEPERQP